MIPCFLFVLFVFIYLFPTDSKFKTISNQCQTFCKYLCGLDRFYKGTQIFQRHLRKGKSSRESERRSGRLRGVHGGIQGVGGKQELARHVRARGDHARCVLLARGER